MTRPLRGLLMTLGLAAGGAIFGAGAGAVAITLAAGPGAAAAFVPLAAAGYVGAVFGVVTALVAIATGSEVRARQ